MGIWLLEIAFKKEYKLSSDVFGCRYSTYTIGTNSNIPTLSVFEYYTLLPLFYQIFAIKI
jgi:hypothetical protein